jgi:hypothetical protein
MVIKRPYVTIPIDYRDGTETLGVPLFEKSVTFKLRLAMALFVKIQLLWFSN